MKIALLNFLFDNNYGGNIQRFALMRVLENLGHEPVHLFTCADWRINSRFPFLTILKRTARRILKGPTNILPEYHLRQEYWKRNSQMMQFYERYVKHTKRITTYDDFSKYTYFDAYVVGSDQVWRRSYSWYFPFSSMFLDFVKDKKNIKRVAYGVSFGTDNDEIPEEEKSYLKTLYEKFDAVSLREDSGQTLLERYGWNSPKAVQVIDPTLLLPKDEYIKIIKSGKTEPSGGNMFCYILDDNDQVKEIIKSVANEKELTPFKTSLKIGEMYSMEQWLRSFMDSEHIVTDSYHGFLFSIIFNKSVTLTYNEARGNSRFETLMHLLGINDLDNIDWNSVNSLIDKMRTQSINFLKKSLS